MTTQWMSIHSRFRSFPFQTQGKRGSFKFVAALGMALGLASGCGFLGQTGEDLADEAYQALDEGDLPGAADQFAALYAKHPTSMPVGIGHAYFQLLAGDMVGADQTLEALEAEASDEEKAQLRLRRALVAIEAGSMPAIGVHAGASDLPAAKLILAEWDFYEFDSDKAEALFRDLADEPGRVGATAETYLKWLESGDVGSDLVFTHVQWALGEHRAAIENAAAVLLSDELLPVEDVDEMLLVWAGRAASYPAGEDREDLLKWANDFLEHMEGPAGQPWRMHATRAIIAVGQDRVQGARTIFDMLGEMPGVPADGLADARSTACMVAPDKVVAKELVEGLESAAAARCLLLAGAPQAAKHAAPPGTLKSYLENR